MKPFHLDEKTIAELGLYESAEPITAPAAPDARVFRFHNLENIYVMETDLYGNTMPEGTCFLAFHGRNGLMGKRLSLDTLRSNSIEDIRKFVDDNHSG